MRTDYCSQKGAEGGAASEGSTGTGMIGCKHAMSIEL